MSDTRVSRVRLRFAKHGDLRLLSHHDVMRCLERALRRANLPVASTQGFNPRPRMSIALALGLGIEGRREILDLDLTEPLVPEEVVHRLAEVLPAGLDMLEGERAPTGAAARPSVLAYRLTVPEPRRAATAQILSRFLEATEWPIVREREGKATTLDLRWFVLEATLDELGVLRVRLRVAPNGTARPDELLDALQLRDLLTSGGVLVRDDIELVEAANAREPKSVPAPVPTVPQSVPTDHPSTTTKVDAELR